MFKLNSQFEVLNIHILYSSCKCSFETFDSSPLLPPIARDRGVKVKGKENKEGGLFLIYHCIELNPRESQFLRTRTLTRFPALSRIGALFHIPELSEM